MIIISARTGRPKGDKPPKKNYAFRLDESENDFIDLYSQANKVTRTETVSRGLKKLKDDWKNKK